MSSGGAWDIFYGICATIDTIVYKFVGWLYQLYMLISKAKIFRTETFQLFINRVYIILGVVMLFFLAYTILRNIVEPDNLISGENSLGKIISNTVISLVLIAVLPTIFNFLYYAQEILLSQNIIGKIVLGNYSSVSNNLEVNFDSETCQSLNNLGGDLKTNEDGGCTVAYEGDNQSNSIDLAGNSIAVDIFSAFYYPYLSVEDYNKSEALAREEAEKVDGELSADDYANSNQFYNKTFEYSDFEDDDNKLNDKEKNLYFTVANYDSCHNMSGAYVYGRAAQACAEDMVLYNSENNKGPESLPLNYKSILQYAKTTGDMAGFKLLSRFVDDGKMEYSIIIAFLAGLFVCYMMISYCIDMGLRAAKLGFAQLVAPIPILARIVPKQAQIFSSWVSFTLKSYFEVFVRIAIIFLGIFMITNLPSIQGMWDDSIISKISIMSLKTPLILDINETTWGLRTLARVAVIIGILMFVKQAPELINEALGINISAGSLNIRNKLKNMVGGETLVKGLNAVGAVPGKALGAVRGALGGMWAAQTHGNGAKGFTKAAALKGLRAGWQNSKGSFRNNFQTVASDASGDHKYKQSLLGGNTIGGNINRAIDERYKAGTKATEDKHIEELKNVIRAYETAPNSRFVQQQNRMEQTIKNMEQSAAFQQRRNVNQERLRKEWDANEGQEVRRRMAEYEHSQEYKNIHDQAWYKARADVRAEAQKNGQKLNMMEENERVEKKLSSYIAQEIEKANSSAAKQYKADRERERNIDKELNRKAHNETIEQFKQLNDNYKQAKNSLDENNKLTANAAKQISDSIVKNPTSADETSYAKAKAELNNYDKASSDKALQANLKEVLKDLKIDTK